MIGPDGRRINKYCKIEKEYPENDWERSWALPSILGLESNDYTFLWRMVHNILPTQDRLCRILKNVSSPVCTLCKSNQICNLTHALFICNYNVQVGNWL